MRLIVFLGGIFITILATAFSFYPVFQDFNESDYVIPLYKFDDYPNGKDLLIMNVYQDCKHADNIFSSYTINGDPICTIAENLVFLLIFMIVTGIIIMIGGIFLPSKYGISFKQS